MKKLDLRKEFKSLLTPPSKNVVMVQVARYQFLMIDGRGDPNTSPLFQESIQALYALSYGLKFTLKKEKAVDYPVMPIEGLFSGEGVEWFKANRQDWRWTLMILQPGVVTKTWVERIRALTLEKGKAPAAARVRFEPYREGRSVQIMHIGPYSAEGPTIARLHDYMRDNGWIPNGRHHEIYLGDPRRSAPEKLRTVVRQPIRKA
jgi:hypothetical protein